MIYFTSSFTQLFTKQTFFVLYYKFAPLSHALCGMLRLYFILLLPLITLWACIMSLSVSFIITAPASVAQVKRLSVFPLENPSLRGLQVSCKTLLLDDGWHTWPEPEGFFLLLTLNWTEKNAMFWSHSIRREFWDFVFGIQKQLNLLKPSFAGYLLIM